MNRQTAKRGFSFIEAVVIVAIIAILFGVAMVRLVPTQRKNELEMAANLVQSALVEAREKSQAPKPSNPDPSVASDVNGYGVKFNLSSTTNKEFSLFLDKVDTSSSNQNKWVDPSLTSPDTVDDVIITTYKFTDNNINNVIVSDILKDGTTSDFTTDSNIVFKYSEFPSQLAIYYKGASLNTLTIVLKNNADNSQKNVTVNFKSGEIRIE